MRGPDGPAPVLELSGLVVGLGGRTVLDEVSLSLSAGSWSGLVGPNGAGKTTLLRAALGLVRARRGEVRLFGAPPPPLPGAVGVSFGPRLTHPARRARTELALRFDAVGAPRSEFERAWEQADLLDARVRCGALSLGQAQRLAVLGALAGRPRLVVLDEPTVGLDAAASCWLRERLAGYVAGGGTLWVSSHDLAEVESAADRVAVLTEGGLAYEGPVAQLLGARSVVVRSSEPELLTGVVAGEGLEHRTRDDGSLAVWGASDEQLGRLLARRGVPLVAMATAGPDLRSRVQDLAGAPAGQLTSGRGA